MRVGEVEFVAGAGDGGVDPEEAARQICLRLLAAGPRTIGLGWIDSA